MTPGFQHFEDFSIGLSGVTRSRTLGATEISLFAGITADYAYLHISHQDATASPYGGRIAHGLLGASLAPGLLSLDAPHIVGRGVPGAYMSGFDINYRAPVNIDDTIRLAWQITAVDASPGLPAFGNVTIAYRYTNQHGTAVYDGFVQLMARKRGAALNVPTTQYRSASRWNLPAFDFDPTRAYAFEELVGAGGVSGGRTMTEADIVNFAGLTGDYNPLYVDEPFAQASPFRGRIVPPMLVFTCAFSLWNRDTWFNSVTSSEGLVDHGHLNDGATFLRPVRIGDTIRCVYRLGACRAQKSKPDRRVLTHEVQVINQRDEVVQTGRVFMSKAPANEM